MGSLRLHLLLLLFIASCLFPKLVIMPSAAAVVLPLSPKDSLLRHWARLFPTVAMPPTLLSKSSPLNTAQLALFSSYIDSRTHRPHLPAFCPAANLVCDLNLAATNAKKGVFPNQVFIGYSHGPPHGIFPNDVNIGKGHGTHHGIFPNQVFIGYSHGPPHGIFPNDVEIKDGHPHGVMSSLEAGSFFRQATLATGNRIRVPDIRDVMPKRSFLPRDLADKLPFSSAKIGDLVDLLGAPSMKGVIASTISQCEQPAEKGEKKRCATSIEGMADFAVEALGREASALYTEGAAGSKEEVVVGKVVPRNGGKETRAVSCHQVFFPYLVYYCHMLPRVTLYEVELLGTKDGRKVNQAMAICHMDTSGWNPKHPAFMVLGPAPGKIEVCHFLFENELAWVGRD